MMKFIKHHIWPRYKGYVIALWICVWCVLFFTAITKNPGSGESEIKLAMMKADVDTMLAHGGKVLGIYENAKYGGAILTLTLHDEGWSSDLVRMFEDTLLKRGWKKMPNLSDTFCKDNVEAKISTNSGMKDGHGVNSLSMIFDSSTIKRCSAVPLNGI